MKTFVIGTVAYIIVFFCMWYYLPREIPLLVYILLLIVAIFFWSLYCFKKTSENIVEEKT